MKLTPLAVAGAFRVEVEPYPDERGVFARTVCRAEFARAGLVTEFVQSSISFNTKAGTLRGMHFQAVPRLETKLVRCTQGAAYDVVLDLRRDLPTYRTWAAIEITAANRTAVYIPAGCAHGFQTLVDGTELLYDISEFYEFESRPRRAL